MPEAAVPPEAGALTMLLNTRAYADLPERLGEPEVGAGLRSAFGLGEDEAVDLDLVARVRDLLVEVVGAAGAGGEADWSGYNRAVGATLFAPVVEAGEPSWRQVAGDPLVGAVARSVAELAGSGRWSRLKLCANELCLGAFYDATRSRTRRWHSYDQCGNRINVARHRARA